MDPTLKARITDRLKDNLVSYTPRLRVVAKYIIDHPADFGLDSIRTTSAKTGVSTFSLVRMAQVLGFETFDDLRAPFRQALVAQRDAASADWLADIGAESEVGAIQAEAAANTLAIVNRSLSQQEPERMERVADLLLSARAVYLTATRGTYALAYFLNYVGRMALPSMRLIPRHMASPMDELVQAEPGDVMVAITFTPYSRATIDACLYARRKGVKLILITDSEAAAPELDAEEVLVASTLSTHHFGCFTGAMAVVETLIAILVKRAGPAAKERIEAHMDMLEEFDAYWSAPQKQ